MTYVGNRTPVGGAPAGPADPGLWGAVVDRLDPTRARPVLRAGIEAVELTGARGAAYVLLRSPDDGRQPCYLRLTPQEWQLARMMDGTLTVARLVSEFARVAGRLAPDQVRRVVADLAANRMLDELPGDAFRTDPGRRAAEPGRQRRGDADRPATLLYRAGGRWLFTRPAAVLGALVAVAGAVLFAGGWWWGSQSLFLAGGSYVWGALTLLGLGAVAVAGHETGHALAVKRAGRRVGPVRLTWSLGVPGVAVDTSDAWMAGRRARMRTAAAGPAASLVLAGAAQLAALAVPAAGPVAFKLAFVCYLHTLLQANPFLPLDGCRLLTDWLEVPNLRPRALSWLGGRLRGRTGGWSRLDREGRLVALYAGLAVLWLVVAADLAYRIVADRVQGLVTGLWFGGTAARALLVAVLLGLALPLLYLLAARLGRAVRALRRRLRERDRDGDAPRRLAVLRGGDLAGLPEAALVSLAGRARWVHPPTGRRMIAAGAPLTAVYVVVDGALQARRPGDPGGTVRHRVGPGGVVGLAHALTGSAATLDWHTAGTTLLALPTATVATVIGPLPGPPPVDRAEAEALVEDTPALAGMAADERFALIASAHPVDVDAGRPVVLHTATQAVVVESGVIAMPDGVELRRGTLVGPVGDGVPGAVAQARTPVRLWVIPDASDVPPLVGDRRAAGAARPPSVRGAPAAGGYPPLAVPPGPPAPDDDPAADSRFENRLWWLVLGAAALALGLTAANVNPGPAWAEMPPGRVLLTADRGTVTAQLAAGPVTVAPGDRRYVPAGSRVVVAPRGQARLVFPGGAAAVLCAGSTTEVGPLRVGDGRVRSASATLTVQEGRLLADTAGTSRLYAPLGLTVRRSAGDVVNAGPAWYAVEPGSVAVAEGRVAVATRPAAPAGGELACGDGLPVMPPGGTASTEPSPAPSSEPPPLLPLPEPSVSLPPSESPSPSPSPSTTTPPTTRPTTTPPTTRPTTRPPTTRPTTRPPTTRPTTRPPTTRPTTTPPTTPPSEPPTGSTEPSESGSAPAGPR